jgi:aryl-alcohol dehydrogenase-like predicted oxidoreductase
MTAPSRITALDQYRLLGNSGLRVSPIALGTMTFGKDWGWGSDEKDSRAIFDAYLDKGGNFIDTADMYTNGTSESWIGDFMKGRREQVVLATKFTFNQREKDPNAGGNGRKHMMEALEASLKRLKTDTIDLYYVHAWDRLTPLEELMRALDDAVRQGKIAHVAVSDFPAWRVAQANTLAAWKDWSPFIGLQVEYSLVERTPERELFPMAEALGLGIVPWSPLAGGILTGKYDDKAFEASEGGSGKSPDSARTQSGKLTPRNGRIASGVKELAAKVGCSPAQLAVRWLLDRPFPTFPIIGARTLKQLEDTLGCLPVEADSEILDDLDALSAIELGFPGDFLNAVAGMIHGGLDVRKR